MKITNQTTKPSIILFESATCNKKKASAVKQTFNFLIEKIISNTSKAFCCNYFCENKMKDK